MVHYKSAGGRGSSAGFVLPRRLGKISAAASTQYIIDRWNPDLLINLGTCGGFEGCIERGAVVLVEKTSHAVSCCQFTTMDWIIQSIGAGFIGIECWLED
ncbi:MAG: hypothetical protein EHM41_16570 [Chloroflexi bacterium]|nr:MAG: hypothetical protein EHM41_16570 [Chloroflexota bacterium]